MDKFIELSTQLLRHGEKIRFQAPGHSMQPTIREGEIITIEPVAPSAVRKGDIILYRWEHGIIAHRVIDMELNEDTGYRFIVRGDAAHTCDDPVYFSQVLGKIVSVERKGRCIELVSLRSKLWSAVCVWLFHVKGSIYKIIINTFIR
ncbi:MAG: signal peptidase I [bacterium]